MKPVIITLLVLMCSGTAFGGVTDKKGVRVPAKAGNRCSAIDSIISVAWENFEPISATKYKEGVDLYDCLVNVPGFEKSFIVYDKTPNTYSPGGATGYDSLNAARVAFRKVKLQMDSCLGPAGITYFGKAWPECANWAYKGSKNKDGKELSLFVYLAVMDMSDVAAEGGEEPGMRKWLLVYSMTRMDD